jgi:hypothetical protein
LITEPQGDIAVRKTSVGWSGVLLLACASCANQGLHPVSGSVTFDGAPAVGAAVFFYRHGGDRMNDHLLMGIVQSDGSFELVCGSLGKGAPVGDYDVVIEWKQPSNQAKGLATHATDKLKGRYADPKRALLHAKVEAQANTLPPFALESPHAVKKK